MRVAIVNQFSSAGGGSRFVRALVLALAKADPDSRFDFLADARAIQRDALVELFAPCSNVRILPLDAAGNMSIMPKDTPKAQHGVLRRWAMRQTLILRVYRWLKFDVLGRPRVASSLVLPPATCRVLDGYDVVYLAWPYFIQPFGVSAPIVATFHDFNYKHHFGNFSPEMLLEVERDMLDWLDSTVQPVSSTPFIANELRSFYPAHVRDPKVVYLTTFAIHDPAPGEVEAVRASHALPDNYVVCPTNTAPHKNLATLFRALGEMKRRGSLVPLVLTGFGTSDLNRLAVGDRELAAMYDATFELHEIRLAEGLELDRDIFALGFVSDAEMDALIRGAAAVVAPSRYEAGSGPALDAWKLGTLVVSSDIPPVLQQLEFLGTQAYLFDPDDALQMAEVLSEALTDAPRAAQMIAASLSAMAEYTWDDVAQGYLDVFRSAVSDFEDERANQSASAVRQSD